LITFDEIKYISIRLASGTVDGSNYISKWNSGIIVQEYGTSGAGANNEDYTENPFDYSKDSLADGTYTLVIKYDLGSSTDTGWYVNGWYRWSDEVELDTLTAPSGSYSQSNNEFTFSSYLSNSARVLEFNRSSYTPYSSYRSNEVHNILYNCALRNHEHGIYDGQANPLSNFQVLTMWDTGTYEVKVSFDASHPSGTQSDYSDAVNDWITLINSTISGSGVSFSRNDSATSPDILVETKSNSAMGSTANYIYAGTWETSVDGDGFIYYALVKLNYETDKFDFFHTIEAIVKEEMTQSLGIGGDLTTRADIINTDFNYLQKNNTGMTFTTIDADIQKLLYTEDLDLYVGQGSDIVAIALNPYNGYMTTTGVTVDMYWFEENTTYNYRLWQAKSDNSYSVVPSSFSTFTTGDYPNTPSAPTSGSPPRIDGGLNISWSSTTGCDKYDLYYENYADIDFVYNITGTTYQITGLEYGSAYDIAIRGVSNGEEPDSDWSSEYSIITAPKMPSCSKSADTSSITLNFSGFSGNWTRVVVQYSTDLSYGTTVNIDYPSTSTTINSLSSDTEYNFKVSIYYDNGGAIYAVDSSGNTDYLYFSKSTTPVRPSNWSWTTTIVQGGDLYSVSGKNLYVMPATEWNAFTTRINDFRHYCDLSDYSFTSISSDSDFTADVFNEVCEAIDDCNPITFVPTDVNAGEDISASLLNGIKDSLNSIP